MTSEPGTAMHIGEVAQRSELSLRTLRHYDEIGLLRPSGRSDGGFRLYTEADVERILVIRRMKPLGFSLEAMAEVLELTEELGRLGSAAAPELRERLAEVLDEAQERRAQLEHTLAMADEFIGQLTRQLG